MSLRYLCQILTLSARSFPFCSLRLDVICVVNCSSGPRATATCDSRLLTCESLCNTRETFLPLKSHSSVIVLYCYSGTEARRDFPDPYRKLSRVRRALAGFSQLWFRSPAALWATVRALRVVFFDRDGF